MFTIQYQKDRKAEWLILPKQLPSFYDVWKALYDIREAETLCIRRVLSEDVTQTIFTGGYMEGVYFVIFSAQ